jgi:UDP-N-acetylmuramoylalanine--D-glutamate ligase
MTLDDLKTKKIAILGLGVNNRQLAEYFHRHQIPFEIFENWQSPGDLIGKIDEFDIVFRTPGLPFLSEAIREARSKGAIIYSQTKLFFDFCPAKIIGVTGTKGKGTTAALICEILKNALQARKIWLSGNIGTDPFEFLEKISPQDFVILELSSFQLQDLHKSPHIAVVLKLTPEHLDHHQTSEEYFEAKKPIVAHQSSQDFAVLNHDNETTRGFASLTSAKVFWASTDNEVSPGCFVRDEQIVLRLPDQESNVMKTSDVKLLGRFNLENVTAAIAAAAVAGVTEKEMIKSAVQSFSGLEHRLEFVAEIAGVRFYNDSFSTTPETATAALSAFREPIILIAGGSEKKSDYTSLAEAIARSSVKALLAIGLTGPRIAKMAKEAGCQGRIIDSGLENMEKIVSAANAAAEEGDIVLFSPASASFDMFANYKHRGELFKKYVNRLSHGQTKKILEKT